MGELDISRQEAWARMQEEASAKREITGPTLKSGDGGGTYGGMEARVRALEDKFEKVDSKLDAILKDIGDLKVSVARLTGRVDSMPSSLQLLGFAIAVFVAAGLLKYLAP